MLKRLFKKKKTMNTKQFADSVMSSIVDQAEKLTDPLILELKTQCGIQPNDINKNVLNTELICLMVAVDSKGLHHLVDDKRIVDKLIKYSTKDYFSHLEDVDLRKYIIESIGIYCHLFDKAVLEDKYFDTFLYTQLIIQSLGDNAVKYGLNGIKYNYLSKTFGPLLMGYWKSGLNQVNIKEN
jgi:hypothetical protein